MNTINQQVVTARKEVAPRLREIVEQARKCVGALGDLANAAIEIDGATGPLMESIEQCRGRLNAIAERAQLRFERYDTGLISIAIGGIEKSGKTTLLKTLTGIEDLPAAKERCTAVCCEIIYDQTQSAFDLEFHSVTEFCQGVLLPLIQRFDMALGEDNADLRIRVAPDSLEEFAALALPSLGRFVPQTKSWLYLRDLTDLQQNLAEVRHLANTAPRRALQLQELRQWVANSNDPKVKARVATVARCTIRTRFEGGSDNLRWIDTPGVDDPSPLARERSLRTIGRDADLLVVATMPEGKPDPVENFADFWTSIHNLPDEISLMDRLLIVLNWNQNADPTGEAINKHHQILSPGLGNIFCGPLQANSPQDVARFMDDVNRHLAANLASQDARVIERLENDMKSCLADVRTSVFDKARRLSPADASQSDVETSLLLDWFHRTSGSGQEEGFWPRLRELFGEAVETVPKSKRVSAAQADLDAIFRKHAGETQARLPKETDMRVMRGRTAGEPPITAYMQDFARGPFSDLVNALAQQVREFGPIVQQAILDVLKDAGLGPMLDDASAPAALQSLCTRFAESRWKPDEDNRVLMALEELAGLQQSLQYVYRWEMRAAINFLSPLHWNRDRAVDDLAALFEQGGGQKDAQDLRDFFKANRIPGLQESDETHAAVFESICKFALLGIRSVLSGSRCRLENIADDFIRDFQIRLTFGNATEQAWRNLVAPQRGALLAPEVSAIRAASKKILRFRAAVDELGRCLP